LITCKGTGHNVIGPEVIHRTQDFFRRHLRDHKVEVESQTLEAE
jgi:hypothetical protein